MMLDFGKPLNFDECKIFVDEYRKELFLLVEYYRSRIFDSDVRDDLITLEDGETFYVDYSCMKAIVMLLHDAYGLDGSQINPATAWLLSEVLRMTIAIDEMVKSGEIRKDDLK